MILSTMVALSKRTWTNSSRQCGRTTRRGAPVLRCWLSVATWSHGHGVHPRVQPDPVQHEFSRTLFSMRPDIALCLVRTIFQIDMRPYLGLVTVPCHIIQSMKDLAMPVGVSECMHRHLGGKSVVEVMSADGHLLQLSSPEMVVCCC